MALFTWYGGRPPPSGCRPCFLKGLLIFQYLLQVVNDFIQLLFPLAALFLLFNFFEIIKNESHKTIKLLICHSHIQHFILLSGFLPALLIKLVLIVFLLYSIVGQNC